ncbi:RHS repeat-associated core domain-containing protein [Dysgonomonas sp. Marseille-P4677]|uniref:RHS repeat-associated core domain-containing protein n=1 Tax=Dysgonomonas sp. Marseille-P4677 TaxID=2364790 RepID=UPI001F1C3367|nr:RHS repeat-associated core domain-containing protein [Dysgonomonas sp. Marseille-P4677]
MFIVLNNPLLYTDPRGDTVRIYTETEDWGHTWISVGEGDDMVVYSFNPATTKKGKRDKGEIEMLADGSLFVMRGDEAKAYNYRKSKSKGGGHVAIITDITDEKMTGVITDFISNNAQLIRESEDGQSVTYRTDDLYNVATNNCTTFASDMLNMAGSNILKNTKTIIDRKHGEIYTVPFKERFILPSLFQNWLKKR